MCWEDRKTKEKGNTDGQTETTDERDHYIIVCSQNIMREGGHRRLILISFKIVNFMYAIVS